MPDHNRTRRQVSGARRQAPPDDCGASATCKALFGAVLFIGVLLYTVISLLTPSVLDCSEYENRLTSGGGRSGVLNFTARRRGKDKVKVIAMSLYGDDPRYTANAMRNAELARRHFRDWRLRFYMERPPARYYPEVPPEVVQRLRDGGAEVVYLDLEQAHIAPMLWRFLVADDGDVDVFIVRDADSLLTFRDRTVVRAWLRSGRPFHCIRDHPSHGNYAVSGGMWGARRRDLARLLGLQSTECLMLSYGAAYLQDMDFLGAVIWPRVVEHAFCHDSVSCDKYPNSHPFPISRQGEEHVGQVYDKDGLGRQGDMDIILDTPRNEVCEPPRRNVTERAVPEGVAPDPRAAGELEAIAPDPLEVDEFEDLGLKPAFDEGDRQVSGIDMV